MVVKMAKWLFVLIRNSFDSGRRALAGRWMNKMHHRHSLTRTHTAHVVTHALHAEPVCQLCQLIINEINSRVRLGARKTSWSRGPPGNLPVSRWASPPLTMTSNISTALWPMTKGIIQLRNLSVQGGNVPVITKSVVFKTQSTVLKILKCNMS